MTKCDQKIGGMAMPKISIVPNYNRIETIFSENDLRKFASYGDIIINEERKDPDPDRVRQLIKGAHIIITSWGCPRLTGDILDAAPDLKLVIHAAGSVKGIVTPELWERGIRVVSSAEALAIGVAETTLGLAITALKHVWWLNESVHNGEWGKDLDKVRELYDITIGVIGASRVGKHFIRLLRNFDVNILVFDPFLDEEKASELGVVKTGLEDLIRRSDVVSVHAPEIPSTYKMLNKERLELLKEGAILINTARGSLIDEDALAKELVRKRIYACIDVTDPEPPSKDHPFRNLPNVIMTPHIAGLANNGLKRIGRFVVSELQRYIDGGKLDGEVKAAMLDFIA
jgi:phosphoglycerate dehydrogenase-like enzyme